MSAYQIAIRFADRFPSHHLVQTLPVGGEGTGQNHSLAQSIARFLSQAIQERRALDIEGGFLSHDQIGQLNFTTISDGEEVRVSTLHTKPGHSIFRCVA